MFILVIVFELFFLTFLKHQEDVFIMEIDLGGFVISFLLFSLYQEYLEICFHLFFIQISSYLIGYLVHLF